MNRFKVPLAATLFIIAGVFAVLEILCVYSLLTEEPIMLISHTEQHDDMVIEHRVGLPVSGPLLHLLLLSITACSATAGFLALRTSRVARQPESPNAP